MKKLMFGLAAFLTAAAVAGMTAATMPASAEDDEVYTAYICGQAGLDAFWNTTDEGQSVAEITGDGTYTASYTFQGGSASIECLVLETNINLYDYSPDGAAAGDYGVPEGCTLNCTVDSIEVVHFDETTTEIEYTGPSDGAFRTNDDGVFARLNILNTWGNDVTDMDGDLSALGGIAAGETLSVTFTITGLDADAEAEDSGDTSDSEEETDSTADTDDTTSDSEDWQGTIWMAISAGTESAWNPEDAGQQYVVIDSDGTYSVSYTFSEGSESIELLLLDSDINLYNFAPGGTSADSYGMPADCVLDMSIDSIVVNQVDGGSYEIAYTGPSDGGYRANDDGVFARLNILNTWGNDVTDMDGDLSALGGIAAGDTLTVTFTITGIDDNPYWDLELGDVNGDGVIDPNDAYAVNVAYANSSLTGDYGLSDDEISRADVDGSGALDPNDAYYISSYYAKVSLSGSADWADIIG